MGIIVISKHNNEKNVLYSGLDLAWFGHLNLLVLETLL